MNAEERERGSSAINKRKSKISSIKKNALLSRNRQQYWSGTTGVRVTLTHYRGSHFGLAAKYLNLGLIQLMKKYNA